MRLDQRCVAIVRSHATQLTAAALVEGAFMFTRLPAASLKDRQSLAARFRFSRHLLTVQNFSKTEFRIGRKLHPSLTRISAWILATGAASTLADRELASFQTDHTDLTCRIVCRINATTAS